MDIPIDPPGPIKPIPEEELDRWSEETGQDQSTYPLDPEEYWQGIFNELND